MNISDGIVDFPPQLPLIRLKLKTNTAHCQHTVTHAHTVFIDLLGNKCYICT